MQNRWDVSAFQVVIILIVFACTGFTIMFLKNPILNLLVGSGERTIWYSILYYLLIIPIYNVVLLIYGFIFGQFKFFWNFEKKFFARMTGRGRRKTVSEVTEQNNQ